MSNTSLIIFLGRIMASLTGMGSRRSPNASSSPLTHVPACSKPSNDQVITMPGIFKDLHNEASFPISHCLELTVHWHMSLEEGSYSVSPNHSNQLHSCFSSCCQSPKPALGLPATYKEHDPGQLPDPKAPGVHPYHSDS